MTRHKAAGAVVARKMPGNTAGTPEPCNTVLIGGLPIKSLARGQWVNMMVADCHRNKNRTELPKFMTSANGHVISRCARDPNFQAVMHQADGIDADGMSVVFASRWLTNSPLPERVATTDFFHAAAAAAAKNNISFFLLGSTQEENKKAISTVRHLYPSLKLSGHHHGFFDHSDEKHLIREITLSRTDVLWVGLGIPKEQDFIARNRYKLRGVTWIKSCGGLLNFLSGTRGRAPKWMQLMGLEWLHRVALEPKRLFWRYFTTNGHAVYLMLRHSSSDYSRGAEMVAIGGGSGTFNVGSLPDVAHDEWRGGRNAERDFQGGKRTAQIHASIIDPNVHLIRRRRDKKRSSAT